MKPMILLTSLALLLGYSPLLFAGNVELTTYYPAPYEEYKNLKTVQNDTINTVSGSNTGAIHLTHPTSGGMSMITFKSTVNWPSDGGYLAYYDDNNSYNYWGDSGENSALVLGTTNDGKTSASDVVALKSQAAVIVDAPSLLVPAGNVGIGTTTPTQKLHVNGNIRAKNYCADSDVSWANCIELEQQSPGIKVIIPGHVAIRAADSAYTATKWRELAIANEFGNLNFLGPAGSGFAYLSFAGEWLPASDIAYKKDIVETHYGLSTVLKMQPRDYRFKADNSKKVGFIAQEIEKIIPEVVSGEEGHKTVNYDSLTAVLTKAIQEQQQQIEILRERIEKLEKNNA